jgi:hypothetical protein
MTHRAPLLLLLHLVLFCVWGGSREAYAQSAGTLPLSGILSNALGFLNGNTKPLIVGMGLIFNHRAYEPATPLGTWLGLDVGLEVDVVQLPPSLSDTFTQMGVSVTLPPVFPSARMLNVHKGVGDFMDIGGSIFTYQGYLIWGADMKVILANPEEGLTWALRLAYNNTYIPIGDTSISVPNPMGGADIPVAIGLNFKVTTWTPTLIVSRKLMFADPYLLIGYTYVDGTANIVNNTGIEINNASSSSAAGGSFFSSLGLSLRIPVVGFRITLEGTYDASGYNSLGTKIGFNF